MAYRSDRDIPSRQPHAHQQTPPLLSDFDATQKLYTKMAALCPAPDMEEINKAGKEDDQEKILDITNRLFLTLTETGDLHIISAEIHTARAASGDPLAKYQHLKIGIASAARSVELSPNNIQNRYVLLCLLSQFDRDTLGRKLVIEACQQALEIDKSYDQDESCVSTRSEITNLLRQERKRDSDWESMVQKSYIQVPIAELVDHYSKDESAIKVVTEAWDNFTERQELIASAWRSMTQGSSIPIPFTYLESYLDSLEDKSVKETFYIVKDVLDIGGSLSWVFWQCFRCEKKFHSSGLLLKHILDTHLSAQAKSTICSGILERGTTTTSSEILIPLHLPVPQNRGMIFGDDVSSHLLVSPSCLSLDASATASPSLHYSITNFSYKSTLDQWKNSRLTRKVYGTKFHEALEEMSSGVIPDPQPSGEAQEMALERLTTYIDSEIKKKGSWTYPPEMETGHLWNNPFGAYDYREVLLPLVQSYIVAGVHKQPN